MVFYSKFRILLLNAKHTNSMNDVLRAAHDFEILQSVVMFVAILMINFCSAAIQLANKSFGYHAVNREWLPKLDFVVVPKNDLQVSSRGWTWSHDYFRGPIRFWKTLHSAKITNLVTPFITYNIGPYFAHVSIIT